MSKHTPGPWTIIAGASGQMQTIHGADGHYIGRIDGVGVRTDAENKANAALAKAAPDLLAALERLLLCPALNMDELDEYDIEAIDIAYAAVRKAVRDAE